MQQQQLRQRQSPMSGDSGERKAISKRVLSKVCIDPVGHSSVTAREDPGVSHRRFESSADVAR